MQNSLHKSVSHDCTGSCFICVSLRVSAIINLNMKNHLLTNRKHSVIFFLSSWQVLIFPLVCYATSILKVSSALANVCSSFISGSEVGMRARTSRVQLQFKLPTSVADGTTYQISLCSVLLPLKYTS